MRTGDVCCGWIEFEKNGVPLQTSSKCLVIADFESYYNDTVIERNVENIAVGCKNFSVIEESFILNDWAYSGPDAGSFAFK